MYRFDFAHSGTDIFGNELFPAHLRANLMQQAQRNLVHFQNEPAEEEEDKHEDIKQDEEEEEDRETNTIIKSLYIMAVSASTARIVHLLSGIKDSEYPQKIYRKKMIDELIKKGHDKEMAIRALQKNSKITVDAADKWITQNREWLQADIKAKQYKKNKIKKEDENEFKSRLSKEEILNDNNDDKDLMQNTWKLAEKWSKFDDCGLRYLNVTTQRDDATADADDNAYDNNNTAPRICDSRWHNLIFYESTYDLLYRNLEIDDALSIHSARRCLLSIFMNNNSNLHNRNLSRPDLLKIFNICLSLESNINPAHELNPISSYSNPSSVCDRIINLLDCDESNLYCSLLLSFSSSFLYSMRSISRYNKLETNNKLEAIVASVHGRWEQHNNRRRGIGYGGIVDGSSSAHQQLIVQNAQFFQFRGDDDDNNKNINKEDADEMMMIEEDDDNNNAQDVAQRLKLIIRSDPTLCNMGTTYVTIYADRECKKVLAQFSCYAFDNQKNVCIVNSSCFYYTVLSSSWYQGSPPSNVIITVIDITHHFFDSLSEDIVISGGSISNCLSYIECILDSASSAQLDFDLILLQLLQCLEFSCTQQEALGICRVASSIFNRYKSSTSGAADDVVTKRIKRSMILLERAHEELRTESIKHWSSGTFPGAHVQCLLELLLSARQAQLLRKEREEDDDDDDDDDEGEEVTSADNKLYDEYYTKYRNGSSRLSMISLSRETICSSMTMTVSRDAQNRYLIDDFVADCSVSGGGKWYYEVTFIGQCQYCCIGFIDRKYRKTSNTGISNDYEGHCWSIVGPNTQYMHRSRAVQPSTSHIDRDQIGLASWSPNCTVGVKLDLFCNTIEFVFEGKSSGIAFTGVTTKKQQGELYPAVSLNQNTSCCINLGRKPFKYLSASDGYCGFESREIIDGCWWLNKYAIASNLTYYLSHNLNLPSGIVDSCLVNEVSLESKHDVQFEVCKTNATQSGNNNVSSIFADNSRLFNSNRASSTNLCFKVSGFEATEFVVTGCAVRCSSTSNGFKVFVFVSCADGAPDFDQYQWCTHWNESQYNEYCRKRKKGKVVAPHEPIAFASTASCSLHIKLPRAQRGKYLTLQIAANAAHNGLYIEYIKLDCIHGRHPLSHAVHDDHSQLRSGIISELRNKMLSAQDAEINHESLTEMAQIIAQRLSLTPRSLDSVMLEPTREELKRFKFQSHDVRLLQARFALIKYLNRLVTPLLHYIDITMFYDDAPSKHTKYESLSHQIHELKGCYFMSTKKSVFDVLLASTACGASSSQSSSSNSRLSPSFAANNGANNRTLNGMPRVTLNRHLAAKKRRNQSIFSQLYEGLKNISYCRHFRTNRAGAQLWNVTFVGEGSIDVGGPYRESLTYAVADLQSCATNLFILCPNGKNSVGLNREKFIPNPSCLSSSHLSQYEFVGVLMGIALRTKQTLSFDFPSFIYKKLLNLEVKLTISDLEQVDKLCVQALNEITQLQEISSKQMTFVASLSNGTIVELCGDGANRRVTLENRDEFISLLIRRRLAESTKQIEHIKRGLNEICQSRILSLFTWYDLERMICGDPNISIQMLQKHTVYQGGLSSCSRVVKYFWNTLHSFSQHERQLFLRFVWGRNRLPNDFLENHDTLSIKQLNTNNEESLPIAHTCFFSIDLPPYKSFKICRAKILYAINNCQAIDVDFNPNSSSLQAWIDDL